MLRLRAMGMGKALICTGSRATMTMTMARMLPMRNRLGTVSLLPHRRPRFWPTSMNVPPKEHACVPRVPQGYNVRRVASDDGPHAEGCARDGKVLDLRTFPPERIRNFCIVAHIDHGKSTLADRLLEMTGTIGSGLRAQYLDKLQVESERGITVKAHATSLFYLYQDEWFLLNLIDTPGHVDFSYEVSRSLAACQGCLLLIDAAQGVQAQTLANFFLAFEQDLVVIPVINKIDLPTADPLNVSAQMEKAMDIPSHDVMMCSAKTGKGVQDLFPAIIERIPPPRGKRECSCRTLLFDSWFDVYRGVVCLVEVLEGSLHKGQNVTFHATGKRYDVVELGLMYPPYEQLPTEALFNGQVGYLITNMKNTSEARVGDTIHITGQPVPPLPGFKPVKPMVFAGIYPVDGVDFDQLRRAIEKLLLTDASVTVQQESSASLGFGFRCGFLGLLHMDVFQQRLEHEFDVSAIVSAPTVPYRVILAGGEEILLNNPQHYPEQGQFQQITETLEPMVLGTLVCPRSEMGVMLRICFDRRGVQVGMEFLDELRVMLRFRLPLAEIITDFYDQLKSTSSGYATFDYEEDGWERTNVERLTILLNKKPVDALSFLVHRTHVDQRGREVVRMLKQKIHRQLFEVAIQAAVGNRIVARETLSAMRKNVTARCHGGGDPTRKMRLLERQKSGKKKMKAIGNVEVAQDVFLSVMRRL